MDLMTRRRALLAQTSGGVTRIYLYNEGVISPIIGGFDTNRLLWTAAYAWTPAIFEQDYIKFRGGNNNEHLAGALLPIDLTPYKTLCADINIYDTYSNYSAANIAVCDTQRYANDSFIVRTPIRHMGLGRMTVRLNVEEINRAAYIAVCAGGVDNYHFDLYKLWLE